MKNLFQKTRDFVDKSFSNNKAQMLHFDRTVYWLKQLRLSADEAFLIAAMGHDIERAFRNDRGLKSVEGFKNGERLRLHSERGAEILEDFLRKEGASETIIHRVKHLVSKHEVGGDDDQNLLKDVDSLSFVENNVPIFLSRIDKFGYDAVKEKFNWMYERISSEKAKKIAGPFYEKMMKQLEESKPVIRG